SDRFTYSAAAAPSISGVSASSGSTEGGDLVTITGSHFLGATEIDFGTVAASSFTVISDDAILAVAPPGDAATIDITVTTPSGTSSTGSADHYTYSAVSTPTVSAVSPASGPTGGGTLVTITGTNLSTTRDVLFDGFSSAFTIANSTTLFSVAPAHAAGVVDVIVAAYGVQSAANSSAQ